MQLSPRSFKQDARSALADKQLRQNFRGAMDYLQDKRRQAFSPEPGVINQQELKLLSEQIRQRCLSQLPELLEQLERNCLANGIQVHWAKDAAEARELVAQIALKQQAKRVIKGKSMVSEEIGLNQHLQDLGIECLESDMGEYIVQLAQETPSHIIMPAIHKNKQQVAQLFDQHLRDFDYTEDVDTLIRTGRQVLRQKFEQADIGVSGVNFAVAETGSLCLVENEGNGRMSTTCPSTHIALMGIEKVVAQFQDVPPLFSALTRSATGQQITTYFNVISGPRRAGEKDGPSEVHLVLIDNGRSQAYADEQLRATLQCIRCGACMNHCPVYTRIGGHAYNTVYPGPIGKIISPHLLGLDQTKDQVTASSMCGACVEVCPVKIPITDMLQRLRTEAKHTSSGSSKALRGQGAAASKLEQAVVTVWAWLCRHGALYQISTNWLSSLSRIVPLPVGVWSKCRAKPQLAKQSLHQRMAKLQRAQRSQPKEVS